MKTTRRAEPIQDIDLEILESELNWESDPECLRIIDDQVRRIFNE